MRLKINFNSALALSLFWHLLCFFIVTIIIVPVGIGQKRLSEVYFLGTLLDRSSLGQEFIKNSEGFSRRDRGILTLKTSNDKNTRFSHPAPFKREGEAVPKKRHYDFRKESITNTRKPVPGMDDSDIYKEAFTGMPSLEVRSPSRKILFKPLLSDYAAAWTKIWRKKDLSSQYNVEVSVSIGKDGAVESADITKTSGVADIDTIITDYIKKCKFESIETGGLQESAVSIDVSF